MQKALTDKTIEALKPEPKRYEVHDLRCPGLSLRVIRSGCADSPRNQKRLAGAITTFGALPLPTSQNLAFRSL